MTTAPRLTIDLTALAENWSLLSRRSPDAETAAVVKADAYGIGIEKAVPVLSDAGCQTFFTAMVEEAIRVRQVAGNARVFVLNGIFSDTVQTALQYKLTPVLSSFEQITLWKTMSGGEPSAIHVDTGMNRLGLSLEEAEILARNTLMLDASGATTLMSHFACADEPEHTLNQQQKERFDRLCELFPKLEKSLANSAAILSMPEAHHDLTRPGIALYGGEALNDLPNPMKPVVTSQARILQIRESRKGETVGYGATLELLRDSKLAICSAGYADGFHRANSGSGVALRNANQSGGSGWLDGHKVPIAGRVSMDLTAFDVTDVPGEVLEKARWIELFGHNIALDDAARACGTIGYELLTDLGGRYLREYI